jgi:NAD(P)-dependent dehydrogenase (short-subunit alcohol dehydrogenase family)
MSAEPAHKLAQSIKAGGGKAFAFPGDVTEKAFPAAILQTAATEFGPVDILVIHAFFFLAAGNSGSRDHTRTRARSLALCLSPSLFLES